MRERQLPPSPAFLIHSSLFPLAPPQHHTTLYNLYLKANKLWSLRGPPGSLLEKLVLRTASVCFPTLSGAHARCSPWIPQQPLANLKVSPRSSRRHTQPFPPPPNGPHLLRAHRCLSCFLAHTASQAASLHLHAPTPPALQENAPDINCRVSSLPTLTPRVPSFPGF